MFLLQFTIGSWIAIKDGDDDDGKSEIFSGTTTPSNGYVKKFSSNKLSVSFVSMFLNSFNKFNFSFKAVDDDDDDDEGDVGKSGNDDDDADDDKSVDDA